MKSLRTIVFLILLMILAGCYYSNPYQKQQEELAKKLGVSIEDYPNPLVFPEGYYYSILKKGMSLEEIHSIIVGYQAVFHCGDNLEVYYFFDTRDDKALRFMVFINHQDKTFKELQGEDTNSRTISLYGCEEGVLK